MKVRSIGLISLAFIVISYAELNRSLPAAAATFYNVTDLGTFSGIGRTRATGINDLGQVIGESTISFGEVDGQTILATQAFRTAPNSPIDITTDNVGGGQGETTANGINNSGWIAFAYRLVFWGRW